MELNVISHNASNEVTVFKGMKMMGNVADVTDKATKEIIDYVKALPRVAAYTGSAAPSVKIGETVVKLSYKFYTDEEKETYKAYRDGHRGTGSGVVNKKAAYEEACNLVKALEASGCPAEFLDPVRAYAETLKPVDPAIAALLKAAKGMNPEDLKRILGL